MTASQPQPTNPAPTIQRPRGFAIPGNQWNLLDDVIPDSPPRVSVVIVHFCQHEELRRTLLALQRQTHPTDRLELIVVDDGSPEPPTVPDGVLLLVQADRGFRASAARNWGASLATGDVICFLDADTVPEPSYISHLTRLPALSPEVVTVGHRLHADLDGTGPLARIEEVGPAHLLPEPEWLVEGYRQSDNLLDVDDRSYRYIISAVMACSRWFFEEVGGFDESFQEYGGEDWEWAYRAWLAGAVLAHVPHALAWHHGPDFSARELADGERQWRQQREALTLAELIPVPGSRGSGLRWHHPDVFVVLEEKIGGTTGLAIADSILADLPDAAVQATKSVGELCPADDRVSDHFDDPRGRARVQRVRVRIQVLLPVRIQRSALSGLVARLTAEGLHRITVVNGAGVALLRVESVRAQRRIQRWRSGDLYPSSICRLDGIEEITEEISVAAHFGGW